MDDKKTKYMDNFENNEDVNLEYLYLIADKYQPENNDTSFDENVIRYGNNTIQETLDKQKIKGKYFKNFISIYNKNENKSIDIFINRYNNSFNVIGEKSNKSYNLKNRYYEYMENSNIQYYIKELHLNNEKFWYLFLFIYDYSCGKCIDNYKYELFDDDEASDLEEIKLFVENLRRSYKNDIAPIQISLKIGKGKGEVFKIIKRKNIERIIEYTNGLNFEWEDFSLLFRKEFSIGEVNYQEKLPYSFTNLAFYFCDMFICFFNEVGIKRRNKAKISNIEKGLLSEILFFSKISEDVGLLNYNNNNYGSINRFIYHKPVEFNTRNKYY